MQIQDGSMTGKRVIVTGPTSGFGKEIAAQLAALGADRKGRVHKSSIATLKPVRSVKVFLLPEK